MTTNLKQVLTIGLFFCFFSSLMAQNLYWQRIEDNDVALNPKVERNSTPEKFQTKTGRGLSVKSNQWKI